MSLSSRVLVPTLSAALLLHPLTEVAYRRFLDAAHQLNVSLVLVAGPGALRDRFASEFAGVIDLPSLDLDFEDLARLTDTWLDAAATAVSAVVAGGEYTVVFADQLAARYGTAHHPLSDQNRYRHKRHMRQVFAQYGVPQPRLLHTITPETVFGPQEAAALPYPVILKPADLAGSNFVRRCDTPQDVLTHLPAILACHGSPSSGARWAGEALIEELVLGQEYSAEVVVEAGRLDRVFVTRKFVSPYPHCDETGHLLGTALETVTDAALWTALERLILAWDLQGAVLHVEFKVPAPGDVRVIEAGNRVAGEKISALLGAQRGFSLEEALLRLRLGWPVSGAQHDRARSGFLFHGIRFLFGPQEGPPVLPPQLTLLNTGGSEAFNPLPGSAPGPKHAAFRQGYVIFASNDQDASVAYLDA